MSRFFSKRDIMELICITSDQFDWWSRKLKITPIEESSRIYCYLVDDMIRIYYAMKKTQKRYIKPLESKMNFKEVQL